MRDFQEKRKFKQLVYSRLSLIVVLILIVVLTKAVFGVYEKYRISKQALLTNQSELGELEKRADRLSRGVARLGTSRGVEEEVRLKFSVAKEGEKVIVLVDDSRVSTATATTSDSIWGWFKELFR